jgi:hypothetical protein
MACRVKFTAGPATSGRTRLPGNDEERNGKKIRKRNAGRRICLDARTQAACGTRHGVRRLAPPSACGRARLPAFHSRFSPTGLSSRGFSIGPGFPKAAPKRGHSRQRRLRSQRCTSRAGRSAGRHDARAARVRTVSFRPRAPRSLRRQGVPSRMASFNERDRPPLFAVAAAKSKAFGFPSINQNNLTCGVSMEVNALQ